MNASASNIRPINRIRTRQLAVITTIDKNPTYNARLTMSMVTLSTHFIQTIETLLAETTDSIISDCQVGRKVGTITVRTCRVVYSLLELFSSLFIAFWLVFTL